MFFWGRDEKANYYRFRIAEAMALNDQLTEKITELERKIKDLKYTQQVLFDLISKRRINKEKNDD